MQSWSIYAGLRKLRDKISKGFGNIEWLIKGFICLDSVWLEVWPVAG